MHIAVPNRERIHRLERSPENTMYRPTCMTAAQ